MRGPIANIEGRPIRGGDIVTVLDVHETCNACHHCLVTKQTTRCPSRKVHGITYGLAPETFMGGGCGLITDSRLPAPPSPLPPRLTPRYQYDIILIPLSRRSP